MKLPTDITNLLNAIEASQSLNETNKQRLRNVIAEYDSQFGYNADKQLKVAMFDARSYDQKAFEAHCPDNVEILPISSSLNAQTAVLAKGCKVVCIFVNDVCDAQAVSALAKYGVELIALRCAGFNNVDLAACKATGMQVVRVPAYSPHAVAEHAVALMLMLNRNLHKAYLRNRSGQFLLEGLVGFDMHDKTVGVIGTGKIGKCVVKILLGFGCKVLAYDPLVDEQLREHSDVDYVSLDKLFAESKIITLHSPLTEDTLYMINEQSIDKMQDGVMLINTSRGGLVDTKALIRGLKTEKIASAGLDVYEEEGDLFFKDKSETIISDDVFARLLTFNNVIITSHQAFLTHEALASIAKTTFHNIGQYLQNEVLENQIIHS